MNPRPIREFLAASSAMICIAGILMSPGLTFSQSLPQTGAARSTQEGGVVYQEETVYDFDGDDVEGSLLRPDGTMIHGEQRGKTSSLINIRTDFVPELLKTVESL